MLKFYPLSVEKNVKTNGFNDIYEISSGKRESHEYTSEFALARFSSRGLSVASEIIATAGLIEQQKFIWSPSYESEMCSSTANCPPVYPMDLTDTLPKTHPMGLLS